MERNESLLMTFGLSGCDPGTFGHDCQHNCDDCKNGGRIFCRNEDIEFFLCLKNGSNIHFLAKSLVLLQNFSDDRISSFNEPK